MNKLLIIGALITGLGATSAIAGSAISGEKLLPITTAADYVEATPYVASIADVSAISLSLANRRIIIATHEEPTIEIRYFEAPRDLIDVTLLGGQLTVINEVAMSMHMWGIGFIFESRPIFTVAVTIPRTSSLNIEAETMNGSLEADDFATIGTLDLRTSNGPINVGAITQSAAITLRTLNGRIELIDAVSAGPVDLVTNNGVVVLTNVVAPEISGRASNGPIEASGVTTDDIELQTSNGNVDLELTGQLADYHVTMTTINGSYYIDDVKVSVNSYNTNMTSRVDLRTSNGNINLNFRG